MSQIATGYGLSSSLLDRLLPALVDRDRFYEAFWSLLHDHATETTPDYSFSGSVVAIAIEYLEDKGVPLPVNDSHPTFRAMLSADLSLAMCCDAEQAKATVGAMQQLQVDVSELGIYYVEFTGEEWDEASDALVEGLDYIKRTLLLSEAGCEWVMLLIG
jgi:hypothetical protein